MQVPFVDLKVQYQAIREELEAEFQRVFEKTAFIMGPAVKEFEEAFARYCGVKHAIGVANGTDALTLALKALDIAPGDRVITAADTYIATVEAIVHAGATPVLVDIDPKTYNMDVDKLKTLVESCTGHQPSAISYQLRAIIPVHLYGQPADMDPILEFAYKYGLKVIEDCAQAHGAKIADSGTSATGHQPSAISYRPVGTLGQAACFSFYPAKNLGAYGDGGMVVTDDDQIALTVRKLCNHGGIEKYQHDLVGHNSRLDSLQAAVLLTKLKHLDQWNEQRRRNAQIYDELLSKVDGVIPPSPGVLDKATPVYHLYVVYLEQGNRDELRQYLQERGIQTGIHYPKPVHLTKAFAYLGYREGDFPVTEDCAKKILSLPMYPELTEEEIQYVVQQIQAFMTR